MPTFVPYVAFDPGSRRLGAVAAMGTEKGMRVLGAAPIDVSERDLAGAVAAARTFCQRHSARGIVIERGALYMPQGVTPQAARQIAHHHGVMCRLADMLGEMGRALGIKVRECTRAAWVHRVIPKHRGGITDAMIAEALPRYVVHGLGLLRTKDLRDAAGAWLWSMIDPPPIVRRGSGSTRLAWWARDGVALPPEMRTRARKLMHLAQRRHDAGVEWYARRLGPHVQRCAARTRYAAPHVGPNGGERGRGRHKRWCARATGPTVEQTARAHEALDALFGRPRGETCEGTRGERAA